MAACAPEQASWRKPGLKKFVAWPLCTRSLPETPAELPLWTKTVGEFRYGKRSGSR